jgi:DNA repair protein RadC
VLENIQKTNKTNIKKEACDNYHHIGHRERLRKKFIASKNGTFLDYEILEILLFGAKLRSDVKPLAKQLIAKLGGFHKVFSSDANELRQIKGVNDTLIAIIKAVKEALQIILKADFEKKPILNNWKSVLDYLKLSMGSDSTEKFRILFLSKTYVLIEDYLQDVGTIDQTPLYIREVIKKALSLGASAVIISHNHPSGSCKPSDADLKVTEKLQKACVNIGLELVDHLIITTNSHFSFASNGLL